MTRSDSRGGAATPVYHFTHLDNLPTVVRDGLKSDSLVQQGGLLKQEVGNHSVKDLRRQREVPLPPGGFVADYVPFYFAPKSPMMFAIHRGNVPTYQDGCDDIVYLCSTLGELKDLGVKLLLTDRNAALTHASYAASAQSLGIDWDLMGQTMWNDTAEYPDRREKRMAECLVHEFVPSEAITAIAVKSKAVAAEVTRLVGSTRPVDVRPGWYF